MTEIFEKNRYNGQRGGCNVSVGRYKNMKEGSDALGRRCLLSDRFCSARAGFFDLTEPVFLRVNETDPLQALGFARAASLAPLVRALGSSPRPCIHINMPTNAHGNCHSCNSSQNLWH